MVRFNISLRFESWVDIFGPEGVGLMVLNVAGEYLESNVDHKQKGFV